MTQSASPVSSRLDVSYLVMSTLPCRARHSGEPAGGREGARGLRRVRDTLLTNGAAFKALVYCCPCGSVDSMLWAENAAALSLPALWHSPPRALWRRGFLWSYSFRSALREASSRMRNRSKILIMMQVSYQKCTINWLEQEIINQDIIEQLSIINSNKRIWVCSLSCQSNFISLQI